MTVATLRGERVVLRDWTDADVEPFAALNADLQVMRWFRAPLAADESAAIAARIRERLRTDGFGLWALQTPELDFAGFVGLLPTETFELPLALPYAVPAGAPPHEIGWRLARAAWGRGYATEAAQLALAHARDVLQLPGIVSFTAIGNAPSQAVMRRIGLRFVGEFDHPKLPDHPLQRHVLYARRFGA